MGAIVCLVAAEGKCRRHPTTAGPCVYRSAHVFRQQQADRAARGAQRDAAIAAHLGVYATARSGGPYACVDILEVNTSAGGMYVEIPPCTGNADTAAGRPQLRDSV